MQTLEASDFIWQSHIGLWNRIRSKLEGRLKAAKRNERKTIQTSIDAVVDYLTTLESEWVQIVAVSARSRGEMEAFEGILLVRETLPPPAL